MFLIYQICKSDLEYKIRNSFMKVCVIGSGYVGLVAGLVLQNMETIFLRRYRRKENQ